MKKIVRVISLMGILCLTACSNISQSDYDAVVAERDTLLQENEQLKQESDENNKIISATVHGSFVATVRSTLPSYTLDYTTPLVAVVTCFQSEPFTVFLGKELISQVESGETYVFEIIKQEIEITQQEFESGSMIVSTDLAIQAYNLQIESVRPAKPEEMGLQPRTIEYLLKQ